MKPVLFAICGPTASGKTELAIRVAQKIGAEIVSCDSMQLYTGMDILSAKPSPQELTAVRHHLIGICPPTTKYNASKFREDAERAIQDIRQRGKTPLLCGGTGLYIDALTKGIRMSEAADEEMRARAVEAVKAAAPEVHAFEGRVCSGDQFIASHEQKDSILSSVGGLCCEMEGAAIAQVCSLNGTPFVIIRAISDKADDSEEMSYVEFEQAAAENCAAITRYMIAH